MDTPPPETVHVPIRRVPERPAVPLPSYGSAHAAGMDLCAAIETAVVIEPGQVRLIPSGFAIAVPVGYEAQIRPRSGLAAKYAISMPNSPGTIDADYRGEVQVPLINHGTDPFTVEPAMRFAQMLIKPVPRTVWQAVEQLPETERGDGGFGHTGA
jgi:dUTP pyrophosphatase